MADPRFVFLQDLAAELSKGKISFPTFADATLKVRMALNDPRMNADKLAQLLSTEPLLAARLLRVANSVAYASPGQPVVDVRSAVMRVGFATIRALAVNVALQQLSQMKELAPVAGQAGDVLRHSVDVAALASVIARSMTKTNPDEALFAGLVHDLGRFYMLSRVARYPGLEASSAEFAALADQWHAAVGHAILASLDVPEEIADAVNRHEDAEYSAVPQTLADILNVANRASHGPNPLNELTPDELPVTVGPQVAATLDAAAGPLQALAASLRS